MAMKAAAVIAQARTADSMETRATLRRDILISFTACPRDRSLFRPSEYLDQHRYPTLRQDRQLLERGL